MSTIQSDHEEYELICDVTADTYVSAQEWNANFGTHPSVLIRTNQGESNWKTWTYNTLILCDLSSVPENIYISRALLYVYYYAWGDSDPAGRNLSVHRIHGYWDETEVTWQTRPTIAGFLTSNNTIPTAYGWIKLNVTTDLQAYVNGNWTNNGWQISDMGTWGKGDIPITKLYSRETTRYPPYLFVEYTYEPPNQPPVACAGGPYVGYVNHSIEFDASSSYDTDGTITGYRWDYTTDGIWDTNWNTSAYLQHEYDAAGEYNISVQVLDDDNANASNRTIVTLTILDNEPPSVNFSYIPKYPLILEQVNFTDTSSDDVRVVFWEWDFGDGHNSSEQHPIHHYPKNGTYTVNLTVGDEDGKYNSTERNIIVSLYRCGDVNHDIVVDSKDLAYLKRYLFHQGPEPEPLCSGDVNQDGEITCFDLLILMQYILLKEPLPHPGCCC